MWPKTSLINYSLACPSSPDYPEDDKTAGRHAMCGRDGGSGRRRREVAQHQLPKLTVRVRFTPPAPSKILME